MLVGHVEPRYSTPELPSATEENTSGFEVLRWLESNLGWEPLPWQRTVILRAYALKPDGTLRFRRIVLLCGRRSGKSTLVSALAAHSLAHSIDVLYSSATLPVAREQWEATAEFVQRCPSLFARVKQRGTNGQYEIAAYVDGIKRRYSIASQNGTSARGRGAGRVIIDEVRELRDQSALDALQPTVLAVPQSQIWLTSNAGSKDSVPLRRMVERGRAGLDSTTLYLEWSAPDALDIDHPLAWQYGIPALGHTIDQDGVRMMLEASTPASFRCEVLCQWVDNLDGAITRESWESCRDAQPIRDKSKVTLGFEVNADYDHASLVACERLSDGRFRLEVVQVWDSPQAVREELAGLCKRIAPLRLVWMPNGPANALALDLKAIPQSCELTGSQVSEAHAGLLESVVSGTVAHNGDELLQSHVLSVSRRSVGTAFRFAGVNGVDAAFAASASLYYAKRLPARSKLEMRFAA